MAKSAINVLQEHCIREYKEYPDYSVKDTSSGCSPQFTVGCVIKGLTSTGIASSKAVAKTEAAEQMIKKLGLFNSNNNKNTLCDNRTNQSPDRTGGNFIGGLNEYCSKHNYAYPIYTDEYDGSLFVAKCKHQSLVTVGKAGTKKAAKQESAREMMKLIALESPSNARTIRDLINMTDNSRMVLPVSQSVTKPIPDADLIQLYKDNLPKLEAVQDKTSKSENLLLKINAIHLNVEDDEGTAHPHLRKILNDCHVHFNITVWQKHDPCIIGLTAKKLMKDGSVAEKTFMEMGDRRCDIVKSLLERTIDAFKC